MNKEDKEKIKNLKKNWPLVIKELLKKNSFKKNSCCIYKKDGYFFINTTIGERFSEDKISLNVRVCIKPYIFDNYFWEILKMPSNINEKDSLRAMGAFTFPEFEVVEKKFYIDNYLLENVCKEILEFIKKETENFINFIEKNYSTFEKFILEGKELKNYFYDKEMFEIFSLVSLNKYKEAKKMAEEEINRGNKGNFKNEGKYIYEHLIEWCSEKIK